ncbi:pirin family protein [Solicola gregarius]|uniref:Pirin family protein n=1 Tax=Solicola gregarius TaxID=2908642 RepID=A0AA46TKY5_9ACTN|nr:pirin family protein [Solicola gregarius]UYM07180.1 pirin family protein [Solicola gregarius]
MSNLERDPAESLCVADSSTGPTLDVLPGRLVPLSPRRPLEQGSDGSDHARDETIVNRMLPQRHRRMVGAWCFVDHYGPDDISTTRGMQVPPHPHSGLQTVSWLYEGAVHHQDSRGSDQLISPGELGLMTSGRAISHSEASPQDRPRLLHGMQLWVALPDGSRSGEPGWEHHRDLPAGEIGDARVRVLLGSLADIESQARTYTPIVGAEVRLDGETSLPLRDEFEYAVVVASGAVEIDGTRVAPGSLAYLGLGRTELTASGSAVFLLLGGEPFDEELVMWWNFIGRSHAEIESMRKSWMETSDYGVVDSFGGERMPAPPLPQVSLRPRGRQG